MIFDDFETPEDDFSKIFRGSSETVDFGCFYYFWQFSGDPPESIKILFFDNFQSIGYFIECAGPAHCKPWYPACNGLLGLHRFVSSAGASHDHWGSSDHRDLTRINHTALLWKFHIGKLYIRCLFTGFLDFSSFENPKNRNTRKSEFSDFPEFQKSDFRRIRIFGNPEIRIFRIPDIRISESPDFRKSENPDFPISEHRM